MYQGKKKLKRSDIMTLEKREKELRESWMYPNPLVGYRPPYAKGISF